MSIAKYRVWYEIVYASVCHFTDEQIKILIGEYGQGAL